MRPTDVLRDEHVVILRALDLLESATQRLERDEALPAGWWEQLLDWLRAFADHNHHAKEERSLFPAMVKAGVPTDGGPVGVMLEEHEQGRALIAAMSAGDGARRTGDARAYLDLLRAHIDKENGVLFPLADAVLDEQAQQSLAREFAAVSIDYEQNPALRDAPAALDRLATTLR